MVSVIRIEALSTCARRGGANQNPDKPDSCAPARPAYTNAGPKIAGPAQPHFAILFKFFHSF